MYIRSAMLIFTLQKRACIQNWITWLGHFVLISKRDVLNELSIGSNYAYK